jgi:hypothetical protein
MNNLYMQVLAHERSLFGLRHFSYICLNTIDLVVVLVKITIKYARSSTPRVSTMVSRISLLV